jgi:hypothetical protein
MRTLPFLLALIVGVSSCSSTEDPKADFSIPDASADALIDGADDADACCDAADASTDAVDEAADAADEADASDAADDAPVADAWLD